MTLYSPNRPPWAPPPRRRDSLRRIGMHLLTATAAVAEMVTPPPPATREGGIHQERGQVYGLPARARRYRSYLRLGCLVAVIALGGYAVICAVTLIT